MFTCYLLKCRIFGDTYVGVTGQPIARRRLQHYRSDKFPDGFTLEVLGTAEDRHTINQVEADAIERLKPTLNQRKGGNSVGGYYARRKVQTECKHGHPLTEDNVRIQSNGRRRCLTCYREKEGKWKGRK